MRRPQWKDKSMSIEIRICRADEIDGFVTVLGKGFTFEPNEATFERVRKLVPSDRAHAAFESDAIVGAAAAFPFQLTVPGGEIPTAGVTMVAVLPSHRRRGVMAGLMREQLKDVRARNEPVAILWASEGHIYPRFGYGLASLHGAIDIERHRASFANDPGKSGRVRMLEVDDALKVLPSIYDRARRETPGMFARSEDWWRLHRFNDDEWERGGGSKMERAVWEDAGEPEAYALFRMHNRWDQDGTPTGHVQVAEVMATTTRALREIWRFLFSTDLVERIKAWPTPVDSPLLVMMSEPRRLRTALHDALYLRIVNVSDALEARGYESDGTLVLEVEDEMFEDNRGRYRLEIQGGRASVTHSTDEPDIALHIRDLGSIYLGGFTFTRLERAGRIRSLTPGACARDDAIVRTNVAPFCPEIF
jgi:predicted acetyltransferase